MDCVLMYICLLIRFDLKASMQRYNCDIIMDVKVKRKLHSVTTNSGETYICMSTNMDCSNEYLVIPLLISVKANIGVSN